MSDLTLIQRLEKLAAWLGRWGHKSAVADVLNAIDALTTLTRELAEARAQQQNIAQKLDDFKREAADVAETIRINVATIDALKADARAVLRAEMHANFRLRKKDGTCGCPYCIRDVEALSEHAALTELDEFAATQKVEELRADLQREREAHQSVPLCACCGKEPAVCFGEYETCEGKPDFACRHCCAHGNEDGWCVPLAEVPAQWAQRAKWAELSESELRREREAREQAEQRIATLVDLAHEVNARFCNGWTIDGGDGESRCMECDAKTVPVGVSRHDRVCPFNVIDGLLSLECGKDSCVEAPAPPLGPRCEQRFRNAHYGEIMQCDLPDGHAENHKATTSRAVYQWATPDLVSAREAATPRGDATPPAEGA